MKRLLSLIFTFSAFATLFVSCAEDNDFEQRISDLESTVSELNPMSVINLNIIPDYIDGSVKNIKTIDSDELKSHFLYLDVEVTPNQYAEVLSDTTKFIHKATFSPVQTKGSLFDAITVTPKSVSFMAGSATPYLEMYFEFDDNTAVFIKNTPFIVSYSIESLDGVYGFSTPFVPLSFDAASPVTPVTPGYEDKIGSPIVVNVDTVDFKNERDVILSGTDVLILTGKTKKIVKIVADNCSFGITENGELILDGSYSFYVLVDGNYNEANNVTIYYNNLDKEPDGHGVTINYTGRHIVNPSVKVNGIKATISRISIKISQGIGQTVKE